MLKIDQYRKTLKHWKVSGLLSTLGLVASVTVSFPGKAAIPSDRSEIDTGNVAERLAAVREVVGSLRMPTHEGEVDDAQVKKVQWFNWPNYWSNYQNWNKPWFNFNNWGNY